MENKKALKISVLKFLIGFAVGAVGVSLYFLLK
jgi:hypothetical protein